MAEDRINLSRIERYKISNQLRMLEALYPNEAEEFAKQREILESGYEFLYSFQMDHIYGGKDVMSTEECLEVWDTLSMFDAIDRTLKRLKTFDEKDFVTTRFMGYDGNNEGKFMSFAAFTIERLRRFTYLPLAEDGYFNSHSPVREMYQRMLSEWKGLSDRQVLEMSSEQLTHVLSAAVHPENRE